MTPEEPEALLSMFALPGGSRQLETPKSPRPTCDSYVLVGRGQGKTGKVA